MRSKEPVFVVMANSETERGFGGSFILATHDLVKAVTVAREPEKYGFMLMTSACCVRILVIERERVYTATDSKVVGPIITQAGHPVIYEGDRLTDDRKWRERWLQPRFKEEFEAAHKP